MYRVKRVKVMSLAYSISLVYLVFGLILGAFLMIVKVNPSLSGLAGQDLSAVTLNQIILLYPVAYAVGGLVMGILIGLIYNQISKVTGGIGLELKKDH